MSVHNSTTIVPSQKKQLPRETFNGDSSRLYPPPTANYEDLAKSSYLFWEKLKAFHDSYGTKLNVPTVGGKVLDLHQLFLEVTSRGGFEQVYHFNKDAPPVSLPGTPNETLASRSATKEKSAGPDQFQGSLHGCSVTGIIDGKFDNGYLITVKMGIDQLKGVLYHMPNEQGSCFNAFDTPPLGHIQKRSRVAIQDLSQCSDGNGHDIFQSDHCSAPKPMCHE